MHELKLAESMEEVKCVKDMQKIVGKSKKQSKMA